MDIVIIGLLLGGTYALMAMGLQLQYGVARIMNLANGEMLIAGAFGAFWFYAGTKVSPLWRLVPGGAAGLRAQLGDLSRADPAAGPPRQEPGQARSRQHPCHIRHQLHLIGIMLAVFGGEYIDYSYLSRADLHLRRALRPQPRRGVLASVALCAGLYLWLHKTRAGLALRAVSVNPSAAGLVSINVARTSALAFALGGAVTAAGGVLLSMFLTFDASFGVVFTLKALVIVILGGVGDIRGTIVASFILGFAETAVATLIDPGLTLAAAYILFMLVLLVRPEGMFGRRTA